MTNTIYITGDQKGAFPLALHNAEKGDRIVYHIGQHCGGKHRGDASGAHDAGMCLLFCRRVGEGVFEYLAVKK